MKYLLFCMLLSMSFANSQVKKKAIAVYEDTCSGKIWKQDVHKKKACPYCGPSMPNCGKLIKVLPHRKEKYNMGDYQLPNKHCPVSKKEIKKEAKSFKYKSKKIKFCSDNCIKKFKKKPKKYLLRLPINPHKIGIRL